jgi:hypothetical protein
MAGCPALANVAAKMKPTIRTLLFILFIILSALNLHKRGWLRKLEVD